MWRWNRQRSARWLAVALAGCGARAAASPVRTSSRPPDRGASQLPPPPLADRRGPAAPTLTPRRLPAPWWAAAELAAARRHHSPGAGGTTAIWRPRARPWSRAQELARRQRGGALPAAWIWMRAPARQKYGAAFLGPEQLPPFTFYSVGPTVSYVFDFAGGVRRTIEQQRALPSTQQHELDAAALSLSGNVALQALAAASARAQIESRRGTAGRRSAPT